MEGAPQGHFSKHWPTMEGALIECVFCMTEHLTQTPPLEEILLDRDIHRIDVMSGSPHKVTGGEKRYSSENIYVDSQDAQKVSGLSEPAGEEGKTWKPKMGEQYNKIFIGDDPSRAESWDDENRLRIGADVALFIRREISKEQYEAILSDPREAHTISTHFIYEKEEDAEGNEVIHPHFEVFEENGIYFIEGEEFRLARKEYTLNEEGRITNTEELERYEEDLEQALALYANVEFWAFWRVAFSVRAHDNQVGSLLEVEVESHFENGLEEETVRECFENHKETLRDSSKAQLHSQAENFSVRQLVDGKRIPGDTPVEIDDVISEELIKYCVLPHAWLGQMIIATDFYVPYNEIVRRNPEERRIFIEPRINLEEGLDNRDGKQKVEQKILVA